MLENAVYCHLFPYSYDIKKREQEKSLPKRGIRIDNKFLGLLEAKEEVRFQSLQPNQ